MSQQVDYKIFGGTAADNYERYFVPIIPAPLAADLIETAAPVPGEYILDVACGTGVLTHLAAQRVSTAGRVVGVDLNPGMLDVARSIPAPPGASIEWREANAEALPLPDGSFDVVLCQLGLMFVADRPAAVREMRRVLSSGGRVAINVPGTITRVFEIMSEALAHHITPALAGFVRTIFSLHDPSELAELLQGAGFHDVTVDTTRKTLRLPPPADFLRQYIHATPMAAAVAEAGDDRQKELESDVLAQWQDFVHHGSLVIDLPILTATARK
ncbi:MAG: methyltransferase domain-containing protein [Actinomycetota bacterium]|nr:methyltransferase domain-containing protein [Actinomycetota bacterium]